MRQICTNRDAIKAKKTTLPESIASGNTPPPFLQAQAEESIIRAWSKKGMLRVGDVIELLDFGSKIRITGTSLEKIKYTFEGAIEENHFHLDGFRGIIKKFNLSLFPAPAATIT